MVIVRAIVLTNIKYYEYMRPTEISKDMKMVKNIKCYSLYRLIEFKCMMNIMIMLKIGIIG